MSSFSRSSSSTASISSSPALNSRLLRYHQSLPSTAWWEDLKEVYFVRRKQRVKGRGKEKKKDNVTSHQRKGSLPFPLSPSHSLFAFYSPSCKTVLLLPRWSSVPPRTALKTGKPVKKTFFLAKATLSLCDSRATNFPPKSSWTSPVASLAIGTGGTEKETENQLFSVCRTNFRFAHVRVYFDPARSKPWRGPFRKSNRIRFAKPPYKLLYFCYITEKGKTKHTCTHTHAQREREREREREIINKVAYLMFPGEITAGFVLIFWRASTTRPSS